MVEQDNQQGHQYLISQHDMDSITEASSLNCSMNDDWLTVDIACLKETASASQVDSDISTSVQNLKSQNPLFGKLDCEINNQYLSFIQDSTIMDATSPGFYDSNDLNTNIPVVSYSRNSPLSWSSFMDAHNFKMDDVFQVDNADLFHGPTLAELNANDESLFDSFDSFESCLPSENKASSFQFQALNTFGLTKELNDADSGGFKLKIKDIDRCLVHVPIKESKMVAEPNSEINFAFGSSITTSTTTTTTDSSLDIGKITNICSSNIATNIEDLGLQAVPSESGNTRSILLNPKIANKIMPSKGLNLFGSKDVVVKSTSVVNDSHTLSSLSNDEIDNKDDNTDEDFIFSSDYDSDASEQTCQKRSGASAGKSNKKPRYFWQYNMQAKGPKGEKMESFDHSQASDISSVNTLLKVRRGDGSDLTPCPQKLYNIGMELQKLNSIINNLKPVNELPFNARLKSRKEKNKLASRACRLKKKAQHEANKLKLFGLQEEYDTLSNVLNKMKKVLMTKMQTLESQISCEEEIKLILVSKGIKQVAGCTSEFVNNVLNSVEAGDSSGGLINL